MALSASDLTEKLWKTYGVDEPPTKIIKALAEGVVAMMKGGMISGSAIGLCPPGSMSPQNLDVIGSIPSAKISLLMPTEIYSKVYPAVESEINKTKMPAAMKTKALADAKKRVKSESDIISAHIMSKATVSFVKIDGKGTHYWQPLPPAGTGPMPGMLVAGAAKDGKMIGLNGNEVAELVAAAHQIQKQPDSPAIGPTDQMKKMYDEMMKYIMSEVELEFPTGTIQGSFAPPPVPAVPGPLLGGMAMGGKVK